MVNPVSSFIEKLIEQENHMSTKFSKSMKTKTSKSSKMMKTGLSPRKLKAAYCEKIFGSSETPQDVSKICDVYFNPKKLKQLQSA